MMLTSPVQFGAVKLDAIRSRNKQTPLLLRDNQTQEILPVVNYSASFSGKEYKGDCTLTLKDGSKRNYNVTFSPGYSWEDYRRVMDKGYQANNEGDMDTLAKSLEETGAMLAILELDLVG